MAGGAWDDSLCQVCGDSVGLVPAPDAFTPSQPERFVACKVCRFPLCQACYEYERREGAHACPHCKTAYPHAPGQGVEDDSERYGYNDPSSYRAADTASVTSDDYHRRQGQPPQGRPAPGVYTAPSQQAAQAQGTQYVDSYSVAGDSEYMAMDDTQPIVTEPVTPGPAFAAQHRDGLAGASAQGAPPSTALVASGSAGSTRSLSAPFAGGPKFEGPGKIMPDSYEEEEARQPLCRKVPLPSSLINPYRLVIILRLVVTAGFLHWRFTNIPENAVALWAASLVCEVWFMMSWLLDQFPKWSPIKRETFKDRLAMRYEPRALAPDGENKLASVDLFVSTVDPAKEPPITTANTLLSVLALDYPPEKVACYLQDDGGSMITFDCMAETAEFAKHWVPFCRKYKLEPRSPDTYFLQKLDILRDKVDTSFVTERREIKKLYEEFKVRINALVARTPPADGWVMQDGTPWPGNKSRDHPGMIQVFLGPNGGVGDDGLTLPRLVYVSREKRPGYAHHKKAGAMNSLVRVSAVLTNAPYILNLDCDHYINNSQALRDAMCVMMDDNVGAKTCFVQFPQRFDGIDPNDRYANHNTVFFDINMRGLDGVQGPVYVGTGCCFRRAALYGHVPPKKDDQKPKGCCCALLASCCAGCGSCFTSCCSCCKPGAGGRRRLFGKRSKGANASLLGSSSRDDVFAGGGGITPHPFSMPDGDADEASLEALAEYESKYGRSPVFVLSTFQEEGVSSSLGPVQASGGSTLKEAIHVLSCGYEDQTAWGKEIGWIYGSVTEDILTGFKMHCRGWRSVYCMPRRVAFKGSAPINLSDRLQQVLRWALGSVEIFSSRHCPLWYGWRVNRLKFLQRLAYINTAVYPFTSFPLLVYCMLPAICLFTNRFIMPAIDGWSALWFIALFLSILATGVLEMRWSGVSMTEWWRNEQFWVIGGVSAHLFAVFQGMLKVLAGIDTNFTVTAKQAGDDAGEYAELYLFKWTSLLIPPTFLVIINVLGIISGIWQAVNTGQETWGPLFGRCFFSLWVILHLYPFMKGLGGRSKKMPTLVIVWAVLLSSIFSLLWTRIDPWSTTVTGPTQCGMRC